MRMKKESRKLEEKSMFRQYIQLGPVNLVKVKLRVRHEVTIAFSIRTPYVLQIQEKGFIQGKFFFLASKYKKKKLQQLLNRFNLGTASLLLPFVHGDLPFMGMVTRGPHHPQTVKNSIFFNLKKKINPGFSSN